MCAMCEGQTPDEFMAGVIDDIDETGWAVVAVEGDRGQHVSSYTVGLTRLHGHPELIVSGGGFEQAHHVLDELAEAVHAGRRLAPGQVLSRGEVGRECVLVAVADPSRLVLAQAVYGRFMPVMALQVVWADQDGRWPWELCEHHRRNQEMYGRPVLGTG